MYLSYQLNNAWKNVKLLVHMTDQDKQQCKRRIKIKLRTYDFFNDQRKCPILVRVTLYSKSLDEYWCS